MTEQTAATLVVEARRAVHESLALLPAWEADRVRSLIADLETAVESRTAIRFTAVPAGQAPATDDTDLTEADVDRMMAAGTPVQIVTGPPATYGATPATAQTALRDRIAEALADALKPRYGGPQHNTPGGLPLTATAEEIRLHRAQPLADAVLSVLPASVDRAAADLATARDTNRRLNLRAQRLESELAAYRRAVGQWEISDRGTYIPHSSLRAIGLASGKDILGSVRHLKHFERVEQAEARLSRIREWVTSNVVTARNEFGSGYREAQRDIRDLLDGRPTEAAVGAQQPKENQP
jgi:hypothetical protein